MRDRVGAARDAGRTNAAGHARPRPLRVRTGFWLLALINLFVGSMVGLERTALPLVAQQDFALRSGAAVGGFVVAFAAAKAVMNLLAGATADRLGRKRVLVLGWLVSLPVAPLLAWAPSWDVVIAANVLLGAGQALTWSMTANMMVDLMPSSRRGFAAGMNEFAGYLGVAATAFLTGLIASQAGLRPWPFVLGVALTAIGLALSLAAPETAPTGRAPPLRWGAGVGVPSALGLATNLKDGRVGLSLPLLLEGRGFGAATRSGWWPACTRWSGPPASRCSGRCPTGSDGADRWRSGWRCKAPAWGCWRSPPRFPRR
ncbi:MAG: MFS transporter [Trueperaceae bacterium]|nr:MFS transporter [Trueperaceae bacterium]